MLEDLQSNGVRIEDLTVITNMQAIKTKNAVEVREKEMSELNYRIVTQTHRSTDRFVSTQRKVFIPLNSDTIHHIP